MHRRAIVMLLIGTATLGACRKKEPPPQPTPTNPTPTVNQDSIDAVRAAQARADSIARAEAAAREAAAAADRAARASLAEMIWFDYDQFTIRGDAEETLLRKAAVLKANPDVRVTITGHADERGSIEYNIALGMRRAEAAKNFLVNYGIDAGRIEIASLGEQSPLDAGQNEEAWARNRRDEFTVSGGPSQLRAPGSM